MNQKVAQKSGQANLTNLALASRIARVVDLAWIRLRRASLQIESADVDSLPAQLTFDVTQRHSHRLGGSGRSIDVSVSYRLDVINESVGSNREALIEAEFQLRYLVPADFVATSGELRWFAELNGTLNSWPYWRELAQTVLGRAGLGSLTLPLWRAAPVKVDEEGNPLTDSNS